MKTVTESQLGPAEVWPQVSHWATEFLLKEPGEIYCILDYDIGVICIYIYISIYNDIIYIYISYDMIC